MSPWRPLLPFSLPTRCPSQPVLPPGLLRIIVCGLKKYLLGSMHVEASLFFPLYFHHSTSMANMVIPLPTASFHCEREFRNKDMRKDEQRKRVGEVYLKSEEQKHDP